MKIPLYYSQSVLKQRVMVSASKGSSFIFIVIFVRFARLGQAYNSIIKLGFSGFVLPRNLTVWFALLQDNLIYKFVACKSAIQHRRTNRFKLSSQGLWAALITGQSLTHTPDTVSLCECRPCQGVGGGRQMKSAQMSPLRSFRSMNAFTVVK